ncbi:MAG: hypothetical protein K2N51_20670 [Lachnospiraceae bacterium]|nr:hypothetical protein [Lachnospiraceae bacterium]
MNFKIEVEDLGWIDGSLDNEDDLCLHGRAIAYIGENKLEYDATISATALYLLKTLTEDHIINEDNQMLPCCGFFMIPDEKLENVTIIGCPNGIDWSVIHEDDSVRLILEDGTETIIPISEYKNEVFRFADKVESFYKSCSPKKMPEDEYDRNGYITFWKEWHRRRNG